MKWCQKSNLLLWKSKKKPLRERLEPSKWKSLLLQSAKKAINWPRKKQEGNSWSTFMMKRTKKKPDPSRWMRWPKPMISISKASKKYKTSLLVCMLGSSCWELLAKITKNSSRSKGNKYNFWLLTLSTRLAGLSRDGSLEIRPKNTTETLRKEKYTGWQGQLYQNKISKKPKNKTRNQLSPSNFTTIPQ